MFRSLRLLVAVLSIAIVFPSLGSAQSRSTTLLGQIVDAGGRGSAGRHVELVSDGVVVGTTTTSYDGRFMFAVSTGSFVVRTMINGHVAGTRVSVGTGGSAPMALIVLPSAVTSSPQIGAAVSTGISALASISSVAATAVTSTLVTSISTKNDDEILASPTTQQQVVDLIRSIVAQVTGVPLAQVPTATTISGIANVISNLPAGSVPLPAAVVTVVNNIATNQPTGSLTGH